MDPDIKAAAEEHVRKARAQGMPEAEIQAGQAEFSRLPPAEQRAALGIEPAEQTGLPSGMRVMEPPQPSLDPKQIFPGAPGPVGNYRTPKEAIPGWQVPSSTQSPHAAGGRGLLDLVSGGATEKVNSAVEGAPDQAKREVTEKGLSGVSMEDRIRLFMQATGATQQQAQQFVRVNPSWQPASRTAQTGMAGMDPESRAEALRLQDVREGAGMEGMRQAQDAESNQGKMMLEVQNNMLQAEQAFRRDSDSIQQRYDTERAEQMDKLKQIQAAMDSVGTQPRTIREWLDRSGTGKQVTYGLATALSALGGAIGRRGGQPLEALFNRTQANIDAKVKQEQDAYRILGEKAKLNDDIYKRIREATGDDRAALNITKAMYYDAVGKMVEQTAIQYKMDMQSPVLLDFVAKLAKERQQLIAETALNLQEQQSQTDRFNPGGVFAVGGGAGRKAPSAGDKDLREQLEKYGEAAQKRGINGMETAVEGYTEAIKYLESMKMEKDSKLWSAIAAAAAGDDAKAAALAAALPAEQQKALALVFKAGEERAHDLYGANTTGREMLRDMFKHGGYSIQGLKGLRDSINADRNKAYQSLDGTFGGNPDPSGGSEIGNLYRSRKLWSGISGPNVGLESRAVNPIDPDERNLRDSAKLR